MWMRESPKIMEGKFYNPRTGTTSAPGNESEAANGKRDWELGQLGAHYFGRAAGGRLVARK